jgi:hypothetical protein
LFGFDPDEHYLSLAVVEPEEKTEEAAKRKRAGKKPTGFGKTDESHQKNPEDDEQTDRMAG